MPAPRPVVSGLPAPTPDEAAHGARLCAHLRECIARETPLASEPEATIGFADFMHEALYAPGLGYYAAGATKLGAAGDFVTAPELSPLFAATLTDAFAPIMDEGVLELGAGSGRLARDAIAAAPSLHGRWRVLEVSADLRERQRGALEGAGVVWLDALPERLRGLVLGNEVLDAIACEIVRHHDGRYEQARVAIADTGFAWRWRPLTDDGPLLAAAQVRMPPIAGYQSEINLRAEALVATLAERLDDGALCFIDYGFPRREYYHPERGAGTLACHYRQRVHFDPLQRVGLQDITAHVDFTAIAEAAVDAGLQVICYATQAQFLLHAGLLGRLERQTFASERERALAIGAVQKLLSPAEMGELFKVLVVGRGDAVAKLGALSAFDQSYRL